MNIEYFSDYIDIIKNQDLRELTIDYLNRVPDYFWTVASSISGKHHPLDERGNEGLLLHTKRVVIFAIQAARASNVDQDPYIVAGLCHDTYKYGSDSIASSKQFMVHGELAAGTMLIMVGNVEGTAKYHWLKASNLVLTHNGRWGNIPPRDSEELSFHLADLYAANMVVEYEVQ